MKIDRKKALYVGGAALLLALIIVTLWLVMRDGGSSSTITERIVERIVHDPADTTTERGSPPANETSESPARAAQTVVTSSVFETPSNDEEAPQAVFLDDWNQDPHESPAGIHFSEDDDDPPALMYERRDSDIMMMHASDGGAGRMGSITRAFPNEVNHKRYRLEGMRPDNMYVYRARDSTAFYVDVSRFRMPYHSIFAVEEGSDSISTIGEKSALLFGQEDIPHVVDEPPFVYDSHAHHPVMPETIVNAHNFPVHGNNTRLAVTARYFEYTFTMRGETFCIRVLVSPGGGKGMFGDVVVDLSDGGADDEPDFHWFDTSLGVFTAYRPESPARLVDESDYDRLWELCDAASMFAVPVPVTLLTAIDWEGLRTRVEHNIPSIIHIDIVPETAIMFRRSPPHGSQRSDLTQWIMNNLSFPALTSCLSAIVRIEG